MFARGVNALILVILGTHGLECAQYEFGETNSSQCAFFSESKNTFTIDPSVCSGKNTCQNNHTYYGSYIDIMTKKSIYCTDYVPSPKIRGDYEGYPGSKCWYYDDCNSHYTKGCQNGVCKGYGKNETFDCYYYQNDYSEYCEPGLFSQYQTGHKCRCVDQYQEGSVCNITQQCQNNYLCANSTCTKVGSLKNGEKVNAGPNENLSLVCESLYMNPITKQCQNPPANPNGMASECQSDADCPQLDLWNTYCQCGLNGKSYCTLAPGDYYYVEYNKLLKEWYTSQEVNKCNTVGRSRDDCIYSYMSKEFLDLYEYYHILANNYQYIKGAKSEVTKVFAPRYYSFNNKKCRALALGGGNDKGAYEAGAVIGLVNNLPAGEAEWDVVTGNGVGAINGLIVAQYETKSESYAATHLENFWTNFQTNQFYKQWIGSYIEGLLGKSGLYNTDPLKSTVNKLASAPFQRFFGVGTTDLLSGNYLFFNTTNLSNSAMTSGVYASASEPIYFPLVPYKKFKLVSGSVKFTVDILSAVTGCMEKGYGIEDIIIDVVLPAGKTIKSRDCGGYTTLKVYSRYLDIESFNSNMQVVTNIKHDFQNINLRSVVYPSEDLPNTLSPYGYTQEEIQNMLSLGKADAAKALSKQGRKVSKS